MRAQLSDCERVQAAWFAARARAHGGRVWIDRGMTWTDGPDGMNVMFPREVVLDGLLDGVARARRKGLTIVGAWLGLGVDTLPLAQAGFEEGWAPWWMTASLADVPGAEDPRVRLHPKTVPGMRRATAHTDEDGDPVGEAWCFVDGDLAGVFDMHVRREHRRRGLGTSLLGAVCSAAREAGARQAVLNATPEGERLYRTCGFTRIGEGITWWRHLT